MKKFQFSLDHVLDYKQQVLEGVQNEHAVLMQRVRGQEELLEELRQRYQDCNRELREAELDMFNTVFIASSATRESAGKMVTPRGYEKKCGW